jgi:hypothetical protein
MIHCSKRKEKKCKEAPEVCEWDGTKCKSKAKVLEAESGKASAGKAIRCGKRKEDKCKEVPDICKWDGVKCNKITKSASKSSPLSASKSSPLSTPPKELSKLENRHCIYYNNKNLKYTDIVNLDTPNKTPYDPKFVSETNVHMGQRKLLLSEIQLITEYYKNNTINPIVLYVGAAPGTHLITLSIMFPNVYFILYDGAKFDPVLRNYPKVYDIHEGKSGFVTTDTIKAIKSKLNPNNLLFISDIRLGDEDKTKFENNIVKDMEVQEEWIGILKPKLSLLKFRMSYNMKHGDKLKYTKGDILYGVWPKGTSGETRLLVKQNDIPKKINYDFKDYEETMFFHNKYQRPFCFEEMPDAIKDHIFVKANNYCPCYDCLAELSILHKYSLLTKQDFTFVVKEFRKLNKKNALFKDPQLLKILN